MTGESTTTEGRAGERGVRAWDLAELRADFPVLDQEVRPGVPLTYLDNAATSLKPWPVIRAVQAYDVEYSANVHRAVYGLGERATEAYEGARARVASFVGASDPAEIVFTRGATESINLVAGTWARSSMKPGDEILITLLEHHSNLIPWQMLARERGLNLEFVGIRDDGTLDTDEFARKVGPRTRLVALTAMSNVLGTAPPVAELVSIARDRGARVLVDAAQAIAHVPIDVRSLGADFVVGSAHKMFGPTGVGFLWARRELLEEMPPFLGGGGMVQGVHLRDCDWNEVPWKFEAGTPPIAQAIGFGAAADYLRTLDRRAAAEHEEALFERAWEALGRIPGVRMYGPPPGTQPARGPIIGFAVDIVPPHDLASLLDGHGVAIRASQHCAAPLHDRLGVRATGRASFGPYNTLEEVDRLAEAVASARARFDRSSAPRARS